jgi:trehalose 6-phosphate synthase/phosphatase
MSKIIIVSNRLPIKIQVENGRSSFQSSEGGLATGLASVHHGNSIWIGWSGNEVNPDEQKQLSAQLSEMKLVPVFLSKKEVSLYYEGFSNEVLWPVFHYMSPYAKFDDEYWQYYQQVNEKFRDVVLQVAQPGDTVWIHDYQLLLLPRLIRSAIPNITIGFFQHIPFPSYELFRLIPWRSELLHGMLGADLVGFHTYDDARHFSSTVMRILQIQTSSNLIQYNNRTISVESFPMGIDSDKFESLVNDAKVIEEKKHLAETFSEVKLILSIDRLDYSKGIPQRLQAFERFINHNPEYKGKVNLYMIVVPSRDTVPQYKDLRDEIDKLAGNINAKYRTNNWTPVSYFYRSFPVETLSALYQLADICLVTPMRDGMNLVCKEYVASRIHDDGVLILSEMAGASKELTDALIVNPNNVTQISEALLEALHMPPEEQKRRMKQMRELVSKYNVIRWGKVFMERLWEVKLMQESLQTKYITPRIQQFIKNKYNQSQKRLFLLDYDGTLVDFNPNINLAVPDKEVYQILEELTRDEKNHLVIISGREHTALEEWFGNMKLDLVGEHGIWYKTYKDKGKWGEMKGLQTDWKRDVMNILRNYTERTPGSFIEEKSYSLVWHYRKADNDLGEMRATELMSNLLYMISDMGLSLLAGNKVVEIKPTEANKGKTAIHYLRQDHYDFVMAIGDDVTDEDMFKAIKDEAITIKVNSNTSAAKYYLKDYKEVRELLKNLSAKTLISRVFNRISRLIPGSLFSGKRK